MAPCLMTNGTKGTWPWDKRWGTSGVHAPHLRRQAHLSRTSSGPAGPLEVLLRCAWRRRCGACTPDVPHRLSHGHVPLVPFVIKHGAILARTQNRREHHAPVESSMILKQGSQG